MFEALSIKPVQGFLSHFSNPGNYFPLTYHSGFIYENSGRLRVGGRRDPFGFTLHPQWQF
jgi:hypothetical protein